MATTPLAKAIGRNDLETARRLLAEDASQTKETANPSTYDTHYEHAILYGSPEMVKLFIEHGADIEKPFVLTKYRPLTLAVLEARNPKVVKVLLDAGANVEAKVIGQNTVLHLINPRNYSDAARKYQILDYLIEAGADLNSPRGGLTLLHYTSYPEIAKRLIAAGADVNAKLSTGDTPLSVRLERPPFSVDTLKIIELLLENGADVKIKVGGKSIYEKAMVLRHLPERIKALFEEYKDYPTYLRRRHAIAAFAAAGAGASTATRRGGRRRTRRHSLKAQRRYF